METREKWILCSTCDEDAHSELRALSIGHDDSVLCVTGSGCRALSHLAQQPKRLVSVDFSPGQSYLLELKLAAIRNLSYDDLLEFLGVEHAADRWSCYLGLQKHISPAANQYFTLYRDKIESGVLFAGRHEQFYIRFVAPVLRLFYGRAMRRIFAAQTLEEQYGIFKREVSGRLWHWLIRKGFPKSTLRYVLDDPNYDIENDVDSIGDHLIDRIDHTFAHHLARDNDWLSVMFNGRYLRRAKLPHFLTYDSYSAIRAAKTEFEIVTADILEYVGNQDTASIDKFSLSDVSSCLKKDAFDRLISEVARVGRAQGRLCYRNFLAKPKIPEVVESAFVRDDAMCEALDHDDMAFAYSFEVATMLGLPMDSAPLPCTVYAVISRPGLATTLRLNYSWSRAPSKLRFGRFPTIGSVPSILQPPPRPRSRAISPSEAVRR